MTDIENEQALAPALTRAPVRSDSPTFAELGVRAETVDALTAAGITRAFAIQEYALPIALRGTDMIGQAPTGTGKTLAFGLPLLERVTAPSEGADGQPQALVVVPTRELGLQVARDIAAAGATRGVRVLPIYGGVAYEPQVDVLKKGVEILVGTPGRLLDLAKQKQLKLGSIRALVLDEADRMLDLGFLEDVEKILAMLPEQRQTMLFSATMPDPIVALSRRFLHQPVTIHAGHTADSGPSPLTKQVVYRTHPLNKLEMLARILQARGRGLTMIFTRTKRAADRVAEDLDFRGFAVAAVHGDLGQGARERALRAFRTGKIDVLVATDVAARGLDVSGVTHVINYDCPEDPDTYTHRIGRTGRAGATGVAVTFVDWEDMPRWTLIDKAMGLNMPQPPETYHTSPALYADLDIPTDVSGTLPTADRSRAGLSAEVEEDLGGGRRRGRDGGRPPRGRGRRDDSSSGASAGSAGEPASAEDGERPKRSRRRRRVSGPDSAAANSAVGDAEAASPLPAASSSASLRASSPLSDSSTSVSLASDPSSSDSPSPAGETSSGPRKRSRRRTSTSASAPAFSDAAPAVAGDSNAARSIGGGSDAGASNAGRSDAGPSDAGPSDAGPSDAGPSNAGPSDAGPSNAGPSNAGPSNAGRTDAASGSDSASASRKVAASRGEAAASGGDTAASAPRRRRRRSSSATADMSGGSEAGVGTTADA